MTHVEIRIGPSDVPWVQQRLSAHPWKCFEQPLSLSNEAELWALPQYHIVCSSTAPTRDSRVLAKARAEERYWEIDTGHDLMINEPEWVADTLAEVAVC